MTRPDSSQAATYADGGLIGPCTATTATRPDPAPPQRYQATPASNVGDARAMLRHGGDFINLDNEPDNLNSYNLASMRLASIAMNSSPVHDLMQGSSVHSLLAGSAFNYDRRHNPGTGHRHQLFCGRRRQRPAGRRLQR